MLRFFNTAGPCNPRDHYMLPPEKRLPKVRTLIDRGQYFIVHAPRQSGKTTLFRTLAPDLTASGRDAALIASCEVAQAAGGNVERGIAAVLDALRQAALIHLPEDLRPPVADPSVPAETRLLDLLSRWAGQCPRPVVLFLDEIDSLLGDVLVSVLRQLRSGYPERPEGFPHSVALVGLRKHPEERTPKFFNIAVESLTLPSFSAVEIIELYQQHTSETGQSFTPEAVRLVFDLTEGHPWLVNALAKQAIHGKVVDSGAVIEVRHIEAAQESLSQGRADHSASVIAPLTPISSAP